MTDKEEHISTDYQLLSVNVHICLTLTGNWYNTRYHKSIYHVHDLQNN